MIACPMMLFFVQKEVKPIKKARRPPMGRLDRKQGN